MNIENLKENGTFFLWWSSNIKPYKWYSCNYCNHHYRCNDDLKKHLWESHDIGIGETYSCVYCSKKFKNKDLLNKHIFKCKYMYMSNNDHLE